MLRLMGAVLIFGSCAAAGLSARQSLRRRVSADDAMLLALSVMISEISCRRTPLPEIFTELAENEDRTVRSVFGGLQRRLREQQDKTLGYVWRANLRETREMIGLGRPECDILCEAANYLGRYDAAEQAAGLQRIQQRLDSARRTAADELQQKGGLYRTCGIALGLLTVLVLI